MPWIYTYRAALWRRERLRVSKSSQRDLVRAFLLRHNLRNKTHYGILGPAGMPAALVARLNGEANELLQSPEQRASLSKAGFEPSGGSPQDFASLIFEQMQKWASIVKAVGFQME